MNVPRLGKVANLANVENVHYFYYFLYVTEGLGGGAPWSPSSWD